MLYLKSCPKCRGDMYLDKDGYGFFRQCLQCSLIQDLVVQKPAVALAPALQPAAARAPSKRAVA